MNKIILIIVLLSLLLLSACNLHSVGWDREKCEQLGYELYKSGFNNRVVCEDVKTGELKYFDVKYLESLSKCDCECKYTGISGDKQDGC